MTFAFATSQCKRYSSIGPASLGLAYEKIVQGTI